jgi:hypothetical protein
MTNAVRVLAFMIVLVASQYLVKGRDDHSFSRITDDTVQLDSAQFRQLQETEKLYQEWFVDQVTPGIRSDSARIHFSDEARRLIGDTTYRDSIYRQPYTFTQVRDALTTTNIRLASWYMLNLYRQQPDIVKRFLMQYDAVVDADKFLIAAYYTYALLDPRITRIVDGKPEVIRPDIMDELFHDMNEIIDGLLATRPERRKGQ